MRAWLDQLVREARARKRVTGFAEGSVWVMDDYLSAALYTAAQADPRFEIVRATRISFDFRLTETTDAAS